MKTRPCLTADHMRGLRSSQVMHLVCFDFNEDRFTYTHDRYTTKHGRFEAIGTFDYGEG